MTANVECCLQTAQFANCVWLYCSSRVYITFAPHFIYNCFVYWHLYRAVSFRSRAFDSIVFSPHRRHASVPSYCNKIIIFRSVCTTQLCAVAHIIKLFRIRNLVQFREYGRIYVECSVVLAAHLTIRNQIVYIVSEEFLCIGNMLSRVLYYKGCIILHVCCFFFYRGFSLAQNDY